MKYHGRGGPWLRRGLWHEASGTTDGEFNSARARLWRGSRGTSNTRTHRKCHRNRGRLLLPWRVYPWASAPSRGRDTGPAHRILSRSGCADFARPITWVPNCSRTSRYLKTGTQPSGRASPPPTVGRGTRAAFHLESRATVAAALLIRLGNDHRTVYMLSFIARIRSTQLQGSRWFQALCGGTQVSSSASSERRDIYARYRTVLAQSQSVCGALR